MLWLKEGSINREHMCVFSLLSLPPLHKYHKGKGSRWSLMQTSSDLGQPPPPASGMNMISIPEEPAQVDHAGAPEFCPGLSLFLCLAMFPLCVNVLFTRLLGNKP